MNKGIHVFETQAQGLQYFLDVLTDVGNVGWNENAVAVAFRKSIRGIAAAEHVISDVWRLQAAPIVAYYATVVDGGDSSMFCDFVANIESGRGGDPIVGTLQWCGHATEGRRIRIEFRSDRSAVMTYHLGVRDGRPVEKSGLLSLPMAGDVEVR